MATHTRTRTAQTETVTPEVHETVAETVPENVPAETMNEGDLAHDETMNEGDLAHDEKIAAQMVDMNAETPPVENDPFAVLDEAETVVYARNVPTAFNPETLSPTVRRELDKSFEGYKPKTNAAGEVLDGVGTNLWMTKKFPTSAMLLAYVAQGRKYAAYKEWTFRGVPLDADKMQDAKSLRFCAKPKESRKPGN